MLQPKMVPINEKPRLHLVEWCLFQATGKCLACARRCPAGATSDTGHDKMKCKVYVRNVIAVPGAGKQLGFRGNSCGLWQTKVPSDSWNPLMARTRR